MTSLGKNADKAGTIREGHQRSGIFIAHGIHTMLKLAILGHPFFKVAIESSLSEKNYETLCFYKAT